MTWLSQSTAQSQSVKRVLGSGWMKGLRPSLVILCTSNFPFLCFRCASSAGVCLRLLGLVFVSPGKVPAGRAKISLEEWAGALTSVT